MHRLAILVTAFYISLLLVALALAAPARHPKSAPVRKVEKIDFNRDIRPLLSEKCLACHGHDPKAIQAGLRLDQRAGATKLLASGEHAIVPGKPDQSELIQRIFSTGPIQMPPPDSHKILSPKRQGDLQTLDRAGCRV